MKPMHQKTSRIFHLVLAISLFVILGGCDLPFGDNNPVEFAKDIILPEAPDGEAAPAEDRQVVVSSLEEELVILDYSKYPIIVERDFYKNKYLGEIFIIKDWKTEVPIANQLTIFGKVPLAIHPDQSMQAMEFKDPNQPVVLTGFGQGWAKTVFRGKGGGGSTICTGEIDAEFRLIGGFYPAPRCTLDVDIITTYSLDEKMMKCEYDNGLIMELPMDEWVDPFTDVKLPIVFTIPEGYVVRHEKTENNITYDLSYYLYNFWGKPPSAEEIALVFGDTPVQFYNTGCETIHLAVDQGVFPEGMDAPLDVWELMLTPESQRESAP